MQLNSILNTGIGGSRHEGETSMVDSTSPPMPPTAGAGGAGMGKSEVIAPEVAADSL